LVLEDHEFQRQVAVSLLRDCGVEQIWVAGSGEEALEVARREPVEVLVCDLQTPGMDGIALLHHIAQDHLAEAIIIASALDPALICTVEEMARSYGLQVLGAVEKPLTRRKLADMLQRYVLHAAQAPQAETKLMPLGEIADAVERSELVPYVQPKVSLSTRKCLGVEALVRWNHPTRGVLPPASFIPVAENTPVMHGLTWLMLEKSIAALRSWGREAWSLSVSVNFSADVVGRPGVVERIADVVTRNSLEPANLVVEVTESTLAGDTAQLLESLARLRLRGFGLSIDDYGTGYSSMQQLSRISFTELKVDRSFVHGAAQRRHLRTILESSLKLAKNLKLKSVAEGVETQEDWDLLRELGCDQAQGYFIAKPMRAEEFSDWHRHWSAR
jgi:EAL domain-containing protein (putative c-di-GMP-specific phosphodiesterase class I)/CheY-like chemotaxis protein